MKPLINNLGTNLVYAQGGEPILVNRPLHGQILIEFKGDVGGL